MKQALKKTTYADIAAHAERLFAELAEDEAYIALIERAAAMDITVTTSVRHTYTDDYALNYRPNPTAEGKIPVGYAMELWFDLTRGGRVLVTGDGEIQCSVGAEAVDCSGFLLSHKLRFHDLEQVLSGTPVCALLEEFLDAIEEKGGVPTPFVTDSCMPIAPAGAANALTRADVREGAYVEMMCGTYTGSYGAEDSVYFAADAFLPHRLFLHGALGEVKNFEGETCVMEGEALARLTEIYEEIPSVIRRAATFTDLYMELCESPLAPPPRAEQLADALTVCRADAFLADCERVLELLYNCDDVMTVIW